MKPRQKTAAAAGVVALCGTLAFAQAPAGHEAHMAQMAAAGKGPAVRLMTPPPAVPDLPFVDQTGRKWTLGEALATEKPVLVNFIFTSCTTICPVMSAGMSQFMANRGKDQDGVRVVSVSIDPEIDTVAKLRAYAERYHAPASWLFLTGSAEAVEAAQRAFGAFRGGKLNHAPGTFVRASRDAAWIALDGFSSAETLEHASMGHLSPSRP
ncbi:MAG: SCO family protein [Vicinamibacteria bacterium]